MRISYTIVDSALGRLLVAGTLQGICAVYLGDDDERLAAELSADYKSARVERNESGVPFDWVTALVEYLSGRRREIDLPIDVAATQFQRRVWQQLQAIPYGSTSTYGEIARSLGYTTAAARAVGRACATNPVSLVIPCHRAVREDGGLGGYRWGLERKRSLIAQERNAPRPGGK